MKDHNIWVIVLVILVSLALVIFLVIRNRKDRKEILPPDVTDDITEETRIDQQRRQDKL